MLKCAIAFLCVMQINAKECRVAVDVIDMFPCTNRHALLPIVCPDGLVNNDIKSINKLGLLFGANDNKPTSLNQCGPEFGAEINSDVASKQTKSIPARELYYHFYMHLMMIDGEADKLEHEGGNSVDSYAIRSYYKNIFKLTVEENSVLKLKASEYLNTITSLDAESRKLIESIQLYQTDSDTHSFEEQNEIYLQINNMVKMREKILDDLISRFRAEMPSQKFKIIDEHIKNIFSENITQQELTNLL
jgi:hypothetical protein